MRQRDCYGSTMLRAPLAVPVLMALAACGGSSPANVPTDGGDSDGGSDSGSDAPNGPKEWTLALSGRSTLARVAMDPASGDAFVAGSVNGPLPEANTGPTTGFDVLVMRVDVTGRIVWAKTFGSAADDIGTGIAFDSGSVYVSSISVLSNGSVSFAPAGVTAVVVPATSAPTSQPTASFLVKLDAQTGKAAWAASPDSTRDANSNFVSICRGVGVAAGAPYMGCTYSGAKFGSAASPDKGTHVGVVKVDAGTPSLAASFSSGGVDLEGDLTGDGTAVFVAGAAGPGNFVQDQTSQSLGNNATGSPFVLSIAGATVTPSFWPPTGGSFGQGATTINASGGNVYVGGAIKGPIKIGAVTLTPTGYQPFFAVLPASLAAPTSALVLGGSSAFASGIDSAGADNVIVGGSYTSADFPNGNAGMLPQPQAGSLAGFVAKANSMALARAFSFVSDKGNAAVSGIKSDVARGHYFAVGDYASTTTFDDGAPVKGPDLGAGFIVRRAF